VIALYSSDRPWRLAVDGALRAAGLAVRSATRPAELAKCLADGAVRLVVTGPARCDAADAQRTAGALPLHVTAPGDTTDDVVRRALEAMPEGGWASSPE